MGKRNIALMPGASDNERVIWIKTGSNFKIITIVKNRQGTEKNFEVVQRQTGSDMLAELQPLNQPEDDQALFESYAETHVDKNIVNHSRRSPLGVGKSDQ
tara:strand:- start:486 stop:785 length:300 start_codon:yes stop_codon:yes gene_type:complete